MLTCNQLNKLNADNTYKIEPMQTFIHNNPTIIVTTHI